MSGGVGGVKIDVYKKKFRELRTKAKQLEESDPEVAADLYQKCAHLKQLIAKELSGERKERAQDRADWYYRYADALRAGRVSEPGEPEENSPQRHGSRASPESSEPQRDFPSSSRQEPGQARQSESESDSHRERARQMIQSAGVSWSDISGLEDIKETLQLAPVFAYAQSPMGEEVQALESLLMYGPPGTGKTMLASATAHELDATFFNISIDQIQNKYYGESPKVLGAVFEEGRAQAPSVLFFDDVDTLVTSRDNDRASSADQSVLGKFLTEMDGIKAKTEAEEEQFSLVLASTNTPWELDDALLSRFDKKVYVGLPDQEARVGVLHHHLVDRGFDLDIPLDAMARRTEGYSSRELRSISRTMVNEMLTEMNREAKDLGGIEEIRQYELQTRTLTREDFENALESVNPGVTDETLVRFERWESGET